MAVQKKFKHETSYDLFDKPEELALEALKANLTPREFVTKYLESMREAKIWNTASEFVATVTKVRAEQTANNTLTAIVDYEVRSGTQQAEENSVRIGIVSQQPDPNNPMNALATKAKECIGKKSKLIRGYIYSPKEECDYAFLLDIKPLQ